MAKKEVSFETALEQLEQSVQALENGELSLDETIARFEDGVRLIRICREKLGQAEKKIEILLAESPPVMKESTVIDKLAFSESRD